MNKNYVTTIRDIKVTKEADDFHLKLLFETLKGQYKVLETLIDSSEIIIQNYACMEELYNYDGFCYHEPELKTTLTLSLKPMKDIPFVIKDWE